jgi:DNA-binding NtrC family response regulator
LFGKLKKMKILLIDDDEGIRDSLSLFFEAEGCRLMALETAEEGLAAVHQENYDIIICDYRLPGMDGLQFLKQIQASHPNTITILITAYMGAALVDEAKKLGVRDLIAKPFTSDAIEDSLKRLTGIG